MSGPEASPRLGEELERPRRRPGFGIMLVLAAGVVVAMPLVYLGLVALLGYGVYLHAINDVGMVTAVDNGRAVFFLLVLYLTPIVAGVAAVLFLLKPFFAPRQEEVVGPTITAEDEPGFFKLLEGIAGSLGAPMPTRVSLDGDVNASASFRRGLAGWFGGKLQLNVGLPLLRGMTRRQLAGVIAHELGHFRQGLSMRLSFVIRTGDHWLAQAVHGRDDWDDLLDNTIRESYWAFQLLALGVKVAVGVSRVVLHVLLFVERAVTAGLLRQMEYDADAAEAQIAGSAAYAGTSARLDLMNRVMPAVYGEAQERFASERVVYDDVYALLTPRVAAAVAAGADAAPADDRRRAGFFDTHPPTSKRVAAAERLGEPGVYTDERPAAGLFENLPRLSMAVTRAMLSMSLGDEADRCRVESSSDRVEALGAEAAALGRLRELFGGADGVPNPPKVAPRLAPADAEPKKVLAALAARRAKLQRESPALGVALQRIDDHWRARAGSRLQHDVEVLPRSANDPGRLAAAVAATRDAWPKAKPFHDAEAASEALLLAAQKDVAARVGLALSLLRHPAAQKRHPAWATEAARVPGLLRLAKAGEANAELAAKLRERAVRASVLNQRPVSPADRQAPLVAAAVVRDVLGLEDEAEAAIAAVDRAAASEKEAPRAAADPNEDDGAFELSEVPASAVGGGNGNAGVLVDRFEAANRRVEEAWAELARLTLEVEGKLLPATGAVAGGAARVAPSRG